MGALKIFLFIFLVLPLILVGILFLFVITSLGPFPIAASLAFVSLFLILIPIGIGVFGFWLWMLIDLLQRDNFQDKLLWAVVLLLIPFIGAILYYFIVYSKLPRKGTQLSSKK